MSPTSWRGGGAGAVPEMLAMAGGDATDLSPRLTSQGISPQQDGRAKGADPASEELPWVQQHGAHGRWVMVLRPDTEANLDGFQLWHADRTAESGKWNKRWLCLLMTDGVTLGTSLLKNKSAVWTMNFYWSAWDLTTSWGNLHVIVFTVHIPPFSNADAACDVLHSVTSSLQTQHPQALCLWLNCVGRTVCFS